MSASAPILSRPWHHGRTAPFPNGYGVGFSALGQPGVRKRSAGMPDPPAEVIVQMAYQRREELLAELTLLDLWLRQARADATGNLVVPGGG